MEENVLRDIAARFLIPFFSGSSLEKGTLLENLPSSNVHLLDENRIAFCASSADPYRLILRRRQPFSKEVDAIPEIGVVQAFVDVVALMGHALEGPFKEDLLATFQRRVVAKAIRLIEGDERAILRAIDQLATWANRRYEGSPISAAIGLRNKTSELSISLEEFTRDDFSPVFSNGQDTLLEFNFAGEFVDHVCLVPRDKFLDYCPHRQAPIARWTTNPERRVAVVLNRLGEILLFRNQALLFARRAGVWSFLTHRPTITQMGVTFDRDLRKAVYSSCLDASFARTGACIGIVDEENAREWTNIVKEGDRLLVGQTTKAKAISHIVAGRNFRKLNRRLRQEMLAIDGATVLLHTGEVLAVGAIVQIPGGSEGGGRLAAAKALAKMGLGIKVSQDGGIVGYRAGREAAAFRMM